MTTNNEAVDESQEQVESAPTDEAQLQTQTEESQIEEAPAEDTNGESRNKKGTQRRIRQLTRKYREAERKAEKFEQELEEIKKRLPVQELVRPNRDDFDTDEEYEDALFDWRDAKNKPEPTEEPKTELPPIVEEFENELEELSDDAVLVVMEEDWPCSKEMTDYIMASDNRAKLAYHLATNTDIAEKITNMSPILAARELAKVEESLSSNDNSVTTLPPPASTGKPSAVAVTDQDKMSTDQWVAKRRRGEI